MAIFAFISGFLPGFLGVLLLITVARPQPGTSTLWILTKAAFGIVLVLFQLCVFLVWLAT